MKLETQIKIFILLAILAAAIAQFSISDSSHFLSQAALTVPDSALNSAAPEAGSLPEVKSPIPSQTALSPLCPYGCPISNKIHETVVTHHILELANNPETKFADWVAYLITPATLGHGCKRTWQEDPDLASDVTLEPSDYRGIRVALQSDRGHQAPLASLCGSPYWQEADYLSNITPQKSDLNEGAWERLENAERKVVTDHTGRVYSITGPLYERPMDPLPNAHLSHKVPSGYWKVVTVEEHHEIEIAAFAMDQTTDKEADFCQTTVTLDAVEKRSSLTLFPALDAQIKQKDRSQNTPALMHALGC